jgi:predicted lysophospholipase L1 biosynthesis ABC-type transport system permease subunit
MTEPSRRGPGVVAALAVTLTVLVLIWVVGAFLLVRYADKLPAPPPEPSPTSSAPR